MTTYVYHIAREDGALRMTDALREFLGGDLAVIECLELSTSRQAVATVVESLFEVTPEIRCDDGDLAERLDRFAASYMADTGPCQDQQEISEQAPPAVVDPTWMKTCAECGNLFSPETKRSRYCSTNCRRKASNREYRAKQNGNGHHAAGQASEPAIEISTAVVEEVMQEPVAEPAADVIANQVFRWLIASSGVEVESITNLLSAGKLNVGERLHHKTKGWWEVFEESGSLNVRQIEGE